MNRDLAAMTWHEARDTLTASRPVILPLGSTEQHGPHMAQSTDSTMAGFWAERLAERVDGLHLPVVPYGQVWSARDFPGTISLRPSTLENVLIDIAESLYRHGVRQVVLLSGHTGNTAVMLSAARELFERYRDLRVLRICYPQTRDVAQGIVDTPFWDDGTFHAAEIETALMLAVAPDLVDMRVAPREYPPVPTAYKASIVPWSTFSTTGVFGDASAATAEKGRALIERWLEVMTRTISDGFARPSGSNQQTALEANDAT